MHHQESLISEQLTVALIQLAKGHQHKTSEALLAEAKALYPSYSDEQWQRALTRFAHAYHGHLHEAEASC